MSHDGVLNLRHVDGVAESTKTMMMASPISVIFFHFPIVLIKKFVFLQL